MEAFARGIQAVLAKDWSVLVDSFIETGFFGNPIMSLSLISLSHVFLSLNSLSLSSLCLSHLSLSHSLMSLYLMSLYLCVWHLSLPFRLDNSQLYWAC
jgi:hypothetical protein